MRFIGKFISYLIFFAVVAVGLYFFVPNVKPMTQNYIAHYFPCRRPIEYSIGTFDKRFGISPDDFLKTTAKAEGIWEAPVHKELFAYTPNDGALKINLIYDDRQDATQKLKKLGITIEDNESSYKELKAKYDALYKSYTLQKEELKTRTDTLAARKNAFESKINYWNSRGGAPHEEFVKLQEEGDMINTGVTGLNRDQAQFNELVDEVNTMARVLNRLAGTLQLSVNKFNTIGQRRGEEFDEGLYERNANGTKIDIYEFDSKEKLVRVLAHEMGHALGLEHGEDPQAIMYRLNEGKNEKLTSDDIAALKNRCGIRS